MRSHSMMADSAAKSAARASIATRLALRVGFSPILDSKEKQRIDKLLIDILGFDIVIVIHDILNGCHPPAPSSIVVKFEPILIGLCFQAQKQLDYATMNVVDILKKQNEGRHLKKTK